MKLAIGIREGNQLKLSSVKAGAERGPVTTIVCVAQQTHARKVRECCLDDGGRAIGTAVIHHDDFVVAAKLAQPGIGFGKGLANARFFIIGWQNQ